jgi:Na+-transporting methylmalonyl-CoA/oxaloacetate decarboxylase gamma subunit
MSMQWGSIDWTSFVLAQADGAGAGVASDVMTEGISIAAAGIVIVFSALLLISLFIASLPRMLRVLSHVWPEASDGHHEVGHPENQVSDDSDVLAAIGFVLHTEFQRQLATEAADANKN